MHVSESEIVIYLELVILSRKIPQERTNFCERVLHRGPDSIALGGTGYLHMCLA